MTGDPLDKAISEFSERFVTIRMERDEWRRLLTPVIDAAVVPFLEAVEILQEAYLFGGLHERVEARRRLSTLLTGARRTDG